MKVCYELVVRYRHDFELPDHLIPGTEEWDEAVMASMPELGPGWDDYDVDYEHYNILNEDGTVRFDSAIDVVEGE